jgi:hypothetical protein
MPEVSDELRVTMTPSHDHIRILAQQGPSDLLLARLASASAARHRWAAPMLIEALSLWQGQPARVVISAEDQDWLYPLGLGDALGLGASSTHYIVEIAEPRPGRRGVRLRGLGDFRKPRRQLRLVWSR